jgi:RNA polymerase sigma factor (sigma-70 family)
MHYAEGPELLEAALVRLSTGDKAALEQVYRLSAPRILATSLRLLGDRSEAEDVLHDTFVRLAGSAQQYRRGRGSAIGWLVTIARNLAIDRLRRRGSRGPTETVEAAAMIPDPAPLAETSLIAGETNQRISGCLGKLEQDQQGAIRSAFFDGLSYSELAELRGVPLGTMKSWIRRGLARVKECLER